MGDQYKDFSNSLSTLIDFYLASMQMQLQMISPINYNLDHQNEKIIISSEAKPKMNKPTVLIPLPKFDVLNIFSPNLMFDVFFGGKEKQHANDSLSKKENIQVITTPMMVESISTLSGHQQNMSIATESTSILEVNNSTTMSSISSTLSSSKYNQSSKDTDIYQYTEKPFDVTFIPLPSTDSYSKIPSIKNNTHYEKQLPVDNSKFIINAVNLQGKTTFYQYCKISIY